MAHSQTPEPDSVITAYYAPAECTIYQTTDEDVVLLQQTPDQTTHTLDVYNFLKEKNSNESNFTLTWEKSELKQEKTKSNENSIMHDIHMPSRQEIFGTNEQDISTIIQEDEINPNSNFDITGVSQGRASPGYYAPAEYTSIQTTDEDDVLLEQTPDQTTHTLEDVYNFLQEINSNESNFTLTSEKIEQKQIRKKVSEKLIMNDCEIQSQSGHEIFGINEQDISTFSDESSTNPDTCKDIRKPSTSKIESDSHYLIGINPELTIREEAHYHNLGMQMIHILGSEKHTNIAQNTASNMTIFKVLDPVASKETICFANDICAIPGSSRSNENMPQSNVCMEEFPSTSSLNQQTVVKTEKKFFECLICKTEIAKHVDVFEGNNLYKCCICSYKCYRENDVLIHIYNHTVKQLHCQICDVYHLEPELHGYIQTCNRCKKIFQCRTLLEDHYWVHETYHFEFCRICTVGIAKHANKLITANYQCCKCSYRNKTIRYIREHLYIHSDLRLFKCDQCKKRFKLRSALYVHLKTHRKCNK